MWRSVVKGINFHLDKCCLDVELTEDKKTGFATYGGGEGSWTHFKALHHLYQEEVAISTGLVSTQEDSQFIVSFGIRLVKSNQLNYIFNLKHLISLMILLKICLILTKLLT